MTIIRRKQIQNITNTPVDNSTYFDNRIGFWADVMEVDSSSNSCKIKSDIGYEWENIPVVSMEWVNAGINNENGSFLTGSRNLPTVNSRVFVLCPTKTITGAFILCSGYTRGDENLHELYAKTEDEKKDKNNIRETVSCGGWKETENYRTGNKKIISNDKKIVLEINAKENSKTEEKIKLNLTAWNNSISIDQNGVSFTDVNGNKIENTKDGLVITDANSNTIELKNTGFILKDSGNNQIVSDTNKKIITINGNLEVAQ